MCCLAPESLLIPFVEARSLLLSVTHCRYWPTAHKRDCVGGAYQRRLRMTMPFLDNSTLYVRYCAQAYEIGQLLLSS
jgi:hypothetical protein